MHLIGSRPVSKEARDGEQIAALVVFINVMMMIIVIMMMMMVMAMTMIIMLTMIILI